MTPEAKRAYQKQYHVEHAAERHAQRKTRRQTETEAGRAQRLAGYNRWRKAHPENPEEVNARQRLYYARHREEEKAKALARYHAKAVSPQFRERQAAKTREWEERNPEKRQVLNRNSDARRRVRRRDAFVERVSPLVVYRRDKWVCQLCHKPMAKADASLDHIVPLSRDGTHGYANVQAAHLRCNLSRGAGRLPAQLRMAL